MMINWTLEQTLAWLREQSEFDPMTEELLRNADTYLQAHPEEANAETLMEYGARVIAERKKKFGSK